MNDSITFIVLGATGDLARRKLLPAIYYLLKEKQIYNFVLIGAALSKATVEEMLLPVRDYIKNIDEDIWQQLQKHTYYQQINFLQQHDFMLFHKNIEKIEQQQYLMGNRLVYCATSSKFFCEITDNLATSGIVKNQDTLDYDRWHCIVYEKPFGHDYVSAHQINECIEKYFEEDQIYRADHYLTKEVVSNITLMRFTNCVLEPLWNHKYIEHVQIELNEEHGVGNRGRYYDDYGALRDVVQNHMLELVALIAMESPLKLTGESIREQRIYVLKRIRFSDGIRGQYKGYRDEQYIDPHSQTETFALLQLFVDTPRWKQVPFYLKTGKRLHKRDTVIHIRFKEVECLLTKTCPSDTNWLTIRIAPEGVFSLTLNAKKPGHIEKVVPIEMSFCHSCKFGYRDSQAYEVLLKEVILAQRSVSIRFDEIEFAWNIIDDIVAKKLPLYTYKQGLHGPQEMHDFFTKYNVRWKI
jgi:glucose-6-phosphate 1-dehydrogenase